MNNSMLRVESYSLSNESFSLQQTDFLKEREVKLVKILQAIEEIQKVKAWSSLKSELFDGLAGSLTQELTSEAKKESPDTNRLNRLAGQLQWAEKFCDLKKLAEPYRLELINIRKQLHGK